MGVTKESNNHKTTISSVKAGYRILSLYNSCNFLSFNEFYKVRLNSLSSLTRPAAALLGPTSAVVFMSVLLNTFFQPVSEHSDTDTTQVLNVEYLLKFIDLCNCERGV